MFWSREAHLHGVSIKVTLKALEFDEVISSFTTLQHAVLVGKMRKASLVSMIHPLADIAAWKKGQKTASPLPLGVKK